MTAVECLDLLADPAGLGLAVPVADQADLFAFGMLGPEGLAQAPLVRRDQPRGGGEDVRGGTVVLFQPDDLRAGEIRLEPQDVADLGPAPAIDRLVVVADAADVAMCLRQQPQPQVLRDVGVLVFVHEDIAEALLPLRQHVRVRLEDHHAMQQQVAEIDGVQFQKPPLVLRVKRRALAVIGVRFAFGHARGRQRAVLPVVDQPGQHPRGPALVVDVLGRDQLLQKPDLVVGVQDREAGFQMQRAVAHEFRMAAQDLDADRMEGAEPGHPFDRFAHQAGHPLLHFARGLVGEGHGQDAAGRGTALHQQMRDSRGQRTGLAGARARQQQHGAVQRFHRQPLRRVQPVQIGRAPAHHRALGQGGSGGGLEGVVIVELAHGLQHREGGPFCKARVPIPFTFAGPQLTGLPCCPTAFPARRSAASSFFSAAS